jgi:hypothetical protein
MTGTPPRLPSLFEQFMSATASAAAANAMAKRHPSRVIQGLEAPLLAMLPSINSLRRRWPVRCAISALAAG